MDLACFEGDPIAGVRLHRIGGRPPAQDVRYPLAIPRLARLIRTLRPTLVHAVFISSYGLMTGLAVPMARLAGSRATLVQSALGSDPSAIDSVSRYGEATEPESR